MAETSPGARAPVRRSRRWPWRFVVLLILATGVGGFVALQKFKPQPAVRVPVKQLPLVRVESLALRHGRLTVVGHGLVRPHTEVVIGAEVAGRVVYVSPSLISGGRVRKGETVIRLDAEPLRATLAQAEADLQAARAALGLAEQSVRRTEELIAQGFLSRQTLDERLANRDQARAALARGEAITRQRRLDVARTEIRSPFHGQVLSERVDVGEAVQPGRELARLFSDDALEILVSLTDRDMALIADPWAAGNGAPSAALARAKGAAPAAARVMVEHGGHDYRWNGVVDRVEAAVDAATRTFNVVVRVPDPSARGAPLRDAPVPGPPLLVGMYATVEIEGRDVGAYAMLPGAAVRDDGRVWLVDDDGALTARKVRMLTERDDRVVVDAANLPAGGRLVVSELRVATEGMQVRVVQDEGRPGGAVAERRR